FAVNPPEILSRVRQATYAGYARPRRPHRPAGLRGPTWLRGRGALATAAVGGAAALVALVAGTGGINAPCGRRGPYPGRSHPALRVTVLLPCAWSAAVLLRGIARYWHDTHGPLASLADWRALGVAVARAASLTYLRGRGECAYPGEDPSPARRRLHAAVFYGVAPCTASTPS